MAPPLADSGASAPTHRLRVIGGGSVASALTGLAEVLAWECAVSEAVPSEDSLAGLGGLDAVVVLSHDDAVDGPALATALASPVGYVGAMGSRHTQQRRAEWLRAHRVADEAISTIRGPVGLDIGAETPAEIAVSIVAEIIAATPRHRRDGPADCPADE